MKFISRCIHEQKIGYYRTKIDGAGRCYTEFLDHDNIERGRVKLALDLKHVIDVVPDGYYITFISTLEDSQWQRFLNRAKRK
jgi:RAB protein geranylgeranyltransferase component A